MKLLYIYKWKLAEDSPEFPFVCSDFPLELSFFRSSFRQLFLLSVIYKGLKFSKFIFLLRGATIKSSRYWNRTFSSSIVPTTWTRQQFKVFSFLLFRTFLSVDLREKRVKRKFLWDLKRENFEVSQLIILHNYALGNAIYFLLSERNELKLAEKSFASLQSWVVDSFD